MSGSREMAYSLGPGEETLATRPAIRQAVDQGMNFRPVGTLVGATRVVWAYQLCTTPTARPLVMEYQTEFSWGGGARLMWLR